MTQQDKDQMRAKFEAWSCNAYELHRGPLGGYSSVITQSAWGAWQAARAGASTGIMEDGQWNIEGANAGEIEAYEHGVRSTMSIVQRILDGDSDIGPISSPMRDYRVLMDEVRALKANAPQGVPEDIHNTIRTALINLSDAQYDSGHDTSAAEAALSWLVAPMPPAQPQPSGNAGELPMDGEVAMALADAPRSLREYVETLLRELANKTNSLAAQGQEAASIHLADLKNALADAAELSQQLRLMDENSKGEVWRWQGDGGDDLASMGNRMGVLIYASDLSALLAAQGEEAEPVAHIESNRYGGRETIWHDAQAAALMPVGTKLYAGHPPRAQADARAVEADALAQSIAELDALMDGDCSDPLTPSQSESIMLVLHEIKRLRVQAGAELTDEALLDLIERHIGLLPRLGEFVIDPKSGKRYRLQRFRDFSVELLARFGSAQADADKWDTPESSNAHFDLWQDDMVVASASGPREQAYAEIMRYAEQYADTGEIEIEEVIRIPVDAARKGGG